MPYKIVEKREVVIDAPHLKRSDLVTMTEAADLLGKSVYQIRNMLDLGRLRVVIDEGSVTPQGTPKRYLLRSEVETMIGTQED